MKIKEIDIYAIRLPLIDPFIISYHTYDDMPSIIVKLTTDTWFSRIRRSSCR